MDEAVHRLDEAIVDDVAIGGALGAVGGGLTGDQLQQQETIQAEQQRQIEEQQRELERQRQEMERMRQQREY